MQRLTVEPIGLLDGLVAIFKDRRIGVGDGVLHMAQAVVIAAVILVAGRVGKDHQAEAVCGRLIPFECVEVIAGQPLACRALHYEHGETEGLSVLVAVKGLAADGFDRGGNRGRERRAGNKAVAECLLSNGGQLFRKHQTGGVGGADGTDGLHG